MHVTLRYSLLLTRVVALVAVCRASTEHHIDTLSVQAALAQRRFSWLDRTVEYMKFTSRVS